MSGMAEPVVQMTPWTYRLFWIAVWVVTMVTLYFVVRSAVAWGVDRGMGRAQAPAETPSRAVAPVERAAAAGPLLSEEPAQ